MTKQKKGRHEAKRKGQEKTLHDTLTQVRQIMRRHSCPFCKKLWGNKVFTIYPSKKNATILDSLKALVTQGGQMLTELEFKQNENQSISLSGGHAAIPYAHVVKKSRPLRDTRS